MDTIYFKDKARLVVIKQDPKEENPYIFNYDGHECYVNNLGQICCMKCLTELRYQFDKENSGTMWCTLCEAMKGTFRRVGYATRIKEK